jgi:multiple sugar transport system permease protein
MRSPAAAGERIRRVARPSRRTAPSRRRSSGTPWLLLAPYLLLGLVFLVGPVLGAVWLSLGGETAPVHLQTSAYSRVLDNVNFWPAVRNVSQYVLILLPLLLGFSTVVAVVAHARNDLLGRVVRLVYYLPSAVVGAPLVLLWLFMLAPRLSPFRALLHVLGMQATSEVLTQPRLPLIFAIMAVFTAAGGWILVLHGALQAVDTDMYEAASLDGCNAWQLALHIKLPTIRRYIAFVGMISFAGAFQLVAEPTIINQAIPGTLSNTWSLNQLAFTYSVLVNNGFSLASVIALMLITIGVLAALGLIYGLRSYGTDERTV